MPKRTGHVPPCPIWCTGGPDVPRGEGAWRLPRRHALHAGVPAISGQPPTFLTASSKQGPPRDRDSDRGHPFTRHFGALESGRDVQFGPAVSFAGKPIEPLRIHRDLRLCA